MTLAEMSKPTLILFIVWIIVIGRTTVILASLIGKALINEYLTKFSEIKLLMLYIFTMYCIATGMYLIGIGISKIILKYI